MFVRETAVLKVARGRLVSFLGLPFAFRVKYEEWRDLQLVSQITFGIPLDFLKSPKNAPRCI